MTFFNSKRKFDFNNEENSKKNKTESNVISYDDSWKIVESCINDYGFVRAQLESFHYFMDVTIPNLIKSLPIMECTCINERSPHVNEIHRISFLQSYLSKVTLVNQNVHKKIIIDSVKNEIKESVPMSDVIFPRDVRNRNGTYSSKLSVLCQHVITKKNDPHFHEVINDWIDFGYIPIMVKSKYCSLYGLDEKLLYNVGEDSGNPGGYFIVNGVEKVIVFQERMRFNRIFIFEKENANTGRTVYFAEIRSIAECSHRPASLLELTYRTVQKGMYGDVIRISNMPYMKPKHEIPLVILFMALGIIERDKILFFIVQNRKDKEMIEKLSGTMNETMNISTQDDALYYISLGTNHNSNDRSSHIKYAKNILQRDFLPHVGDNFLMKSYFLGLITNELVSISLGRSKPVNRDHYSEKTLCTTGQLFSDLISQLLHKMMKEAEILMNRYNNEGRQIVAKELFKDKSITQGLKYSLSTGNWSVNKLNGTKTGVSISLSSPAIPSSISLLSHLRRTNTPMGRDGDSSKPRFLSGSHWGCVCPSETPEGSGVGLVKSLAFLSHITIHDISFHIIDLIFKNENNTKPLISCSMEEIEEQYKIMVNGSWIGQVKNPHILYHQMRNLKRNCQINYEISIVLNEKKKQLRFNSDGGRWSRPLFIVNQSDGKLKITKEELNEFNNQPNQMKWMDFLLKGIIEYIDVEEEYQSLIAMTPMELEENLQVKDLQKRKNYTHCEIHPTTILGVVAGVIPFANHNPAARYTFQCAMGKQAMSLPNINYQHRMDVMNYLLWYAQKPIITTKISQLTGFDSLPSGMNMVVAVMALGDNQEDAIIMNQAFIDRGGMRSSSIRTYDEEEKKLGKQISEQIEKPNADECLRKKDFNYEKLEEDGIIGIGCPVSENDILIGKTTTITHLQQHQQLQNQTLKLQSPLFPITNNNSNNNNNFMNQNQILNNNNINNNIMNQQMSTKSFCKRDQSVSIRNNEHGYVEKVMVMSNSDNMKSAKVQVRTQYVPEVGDKFCLTDDHFVLTSKGWKPIAEIRTGDNIAVLTNDYILNYEHPIKIYASLIKNQYLYHVKNEKIDLLTTDNHKMFNSFIKTHHFLTNLPNITNVNHFSEAKHCYRKPCYYYCTAKNTIGSTNIKNIYSLMKIYFPNLSTERNYGKLMEIIKLLFLWLPNHLSSTYFNNKKQNSTICYVIFPNHIKKWIKLEYYQWKEEKTIYNNNDLIIYDEELYRFFQSTNCNIPYWIYTISTDWISELIQYFLLSSQRLLTEKKYYVCKSFSLASKFQQLCLHGERACRITPFKLEMNNILEDYYILSMYEKDEGIEVNFELLLLENPFLLPSSARYNLQKILLKKTKFSPILEDNISLKTTSTNIFDKKVEDEWIYVEEKMVYCIEVPSHVFYVMRNGKPCWTGNSSRHGQKGVIGAIIDQENMPFSMKTGMIPDMIMNPNAFPSRMTAAQILESCYGKAASLLGAFVDSTCFEGTNNYEKICKVLESIGLSSSGKETFIDGRTGELIPCNIFVGIVFYQRLRHLVKNKIHARSSGPVYILTRQPVEGRARNGGHRFGEMEQVSMISYGCASIINEKLLKLSDLYECYICKNCGHIANFEYTGRVFCRLCRDKTSNIIKTRIPYATKLLFQELISMCIMPRIFTE